MIFQTNNDQRPVENGEFVAFVTGKKSVNTTPKYLRVGVVVDGEDWQVKELSNGKIWKLYPSNIIKVGDDCQLKGVEAVISLTDRL